MSHATLKEVYRIDVSEFTCRSVGELVEPNVLEIDGVEAVTRRIVTARCWSSPRPSRTATTTSFAPR